MKQKNSCDHIGIFSNHSKRLVDFYTKSLGFKKEKKEILPKIIVKKIFGISHNCKFIKLTSGHMKIEIFEPIDARMRKGLNDITGYNHWGYCVRDRKKFAQNLKRKGLNIIEIKRNSHSVYFITDPDGNRIEIGDWRK